MWKFFSSRPHSLTVKLGESLDKTESYIGQMSQLYLWSRPVSYDDDIEGQNEELRPPCVLVNRDQLMYEWAAYNVKTAIARRTPARCDDLHFEAPKKCMRQHLFCNLQIVCFM